MKREDKERQALGVRLIDLDAAVLRNMNLESALLDAVLAAKGMRSHGALRRQKQLIGKLMRSADVDSIRSALDDSGKDAAREKREFRLAESWRDRLLQDGGSAIDTFAETYRADRREIMKLLAQHERTVADREQKRLKRELFRAIRQAIADGETEHTQ